MTSYPGGKKKIGRDIADVIRKVYDLCDYDIVGYCEPFVGMAGVYAHVPELFKDTKLEYLAGDINESVIKMWKAAQNHNYPNPHKATIKRYMQLRDAKSGKSSSEKGFLGHLYSFRSNYFQGYNSYATTNRAFISAERIKLISNALKHVKFSAGPYTQYSNLKNYIIYCDPPYGNGNKNYFDEHGHRISFDNAEFWKWCKHMSKNNIVLVSEYAAPSWAKYIAKIHNDKLFLVLNKDD